MKIIEGDLDSFLKNANEEMEKTLKFFEKELLSLRTGKASVTLVENVPVEAHGQMMRLREVASLSAPDARMIVISPWDKSLIPSVSKAITISDLGLNPIVDGEIVRLQLPMMSSERREEIVKLLAKKLEESKVQLRNVRKDFHNEIKAAEKAKNISEDFSKILADRLQKTVDAWTDKAVLVAKKKETELRTV